MTTPPPGPAPRPPRLRPALLLPALFLLSCAGGGWRLSPRDYLDFRWRGEVVREWDEAGRGCGLARVDDAELPFTFSPEEVSAYLRSPAGLADLARAAADLEPGRDARWVRLLIEDAREAAGREFADLEELRAWLKEKGAGRPGP